MWKTKQAFVWSFILNAPFWAIYGMLPFILFQELEATPLQITLFVSLKPILSLFSIYWSSHIHNRPDRLISNIIGSTLLSHLPFFLLPWISDPWYIIFASTNYIALERGGKPAWMELLNRNLKKESSHRLFSQVATASYLSAGLFPLLFGFWMDSIPFAWRYLFPLTSLIAILPIFLQWKIPLRIDREDSIEVKKSLLKPWKDSWTLLKEHLDFRIFQIGFFLGGTGVMMIQPALPEYFMKELHLSYTELALTITFCKGIGFALTSGYWSRAMSRQNLFYLAGLVTLTMALVSAFLLGATVWTNAIYIAYFVYGVMQAGSELTWHMSGPIFAKEKDSSLYTSVNVMMVGVRGLFAPALGLWLMGAGGTMAPIVFGALLCLLSTLVMWQKSRVSLMNPAA